MLSSYPFKNIWTEKIPHCQCQDTTWYNMWYDTIDVTFEYPPPPPIPTTRGATLSKLYDSLSCNCFPWICWPHPAHAHTHTHTHTHTCTQALACMHTHRHKMFDFISKSWRSLQKGSTVHSSSSYWDMTCNIIPGREAVIFDVSLLSGISGPAVIWFPFPISSPVLLDFELDD